MIELGVNLIPEIALADTVALAVEAERAGYSRCRVYDEGLVTRDVYVTMAAIAAATDSILIGPGITNPYTRHPAQTASAIATLDEMSGGRAVLGIGAGGSLTLDPICIERHRPLVAVRETVEACRALFAGGVVDRDGAFVQLRSARLHPCRPDIEIWLAGRGPRMLGLGGEIADGVILDFLHPHAIGGAVDRVRDAAWAVGRAGRIAYSTAVVTEPDDLEVVRPHLTYRLVDSPPEVQAALGMRDSHVAAIRAALAGGPAAAAAHVRDEWVLPFVLHGAPSDVRSQVADLSERYGIEEFLLPVFDMADAAGYIRRVAGMLRG